MAGSETSPLQGKLIALIRQQADLHDAMMRITHPDLTGSNVMARAREWNGLQTRMTLVKEQIGLVRQRIAAQNAD